MGTGTSSDTQTDLDSRPRIILVLNTVSYHDILVKSTSRGGGRQCRGMHHRKKFFWYQLQSGEKLVYVVSAYVQSGSWGVIPRSR